MRSSRLAGVLVAFLVAGGVFPGVSGAQDDGPDGEVVGLLQQLIQANTSNPPGNEAQVAELLRQRLEPLGFEVEIVPTPTAGQGPPDRAPAGPGADRQADPARGS